MVNQFLVLLWFSEDFLREPPLVLEANNGKQSVVSVTVSTKFVDVHFPLLIPLHYIIVRSYKVNINPVKKSQNITTTRKGPEIESVLGL